MVCEICDGCRLIAEVLVIIVNNGTRLELVAIKQVLFMSEIRRACQIKDKTTRHRARHVWLPNSTLRHGWKLPGSFRKFLGKFPET